ncbi:Sugar kinase of the NBD/HSP70 family, may contain an N-terminal HTH domain [Roseateles sp. YR242]|uniref:ROK family transcriptional regulator n=1 Tax=Roseateles sp. YR242 TaxID=1855305 RepID=UPI0008AB50FD|nr:ROK family transcriptional regulator [Roseateles sp. YR242]SEL37695.1 Sugar kinase of the NBD/HSP70 family, may contain an N-terminal HTH domain [Roseateles sp. YR242]
MQSEGGGSQQLLKVINRMALVRHLCAHPGLSRADLATEVGLTKSTISGLTRELIAEGWLIESVVVATGDLGRRPTPLFINPERLLLLGAEVGIEAVRVVATSLTGEIRARAVSHYGASRSAKACIGVLASLLQKVKGQLEDSQEIIGIGIGLPGGVDEAEGILHFAPNLGWRDLPIGSWLADKLAGTALADVPLYLQNEADVAALGEMEFNPSSGPQDPLLYVSINQGVGAGVVVGDRLLTGSRGFAGEVGHMVLQIDGPRCSCGRRGCAEALIGMRAMLRPEEAAEPGPHSLAEVRTRLGEKDKPTVKSVSTAGRYLGVLLQNLATAYDPACIVLGGAVVELGDAFLQPALDTLNDYAKAASLAPPLVRTSRYGADAVAAGAAALARYHVTRPQLPQAGAARSPTTPTTEDAEESL